MGNENIDECIFTELPVHFEQMTEHTIWYELFIDSKRYTIFLSNHLHWINSQFFKENKHVFGSLLLTDKWFSNKQEIIDLEGLKRLLANRTFPTTPQEKLENLFLGLFQFQKTDGELLDIKELFFDKSFWKRFYFRSTPECLFYFKTLNEQGLISLEYFTDTDIIYRCNITFAGLSQAIKLNEDGEFSNKCFIAMSFKPEMSEIRQAIKNALATTGFEAVLIDEKNVESDRTINDEIIANLKKCKFCIADFTGQSLGVYFESGFAVGQGKKVIYTCQEDDFNKAHFDIKPLQHILYKTPEQLNTDLINKIEAWIIE